MWLWFISRYWTWLRHWRTGRVPSSWCRCPGWWWSAAVQAARDAWSHWAMPSHKLSTANGPSSPLGSQRRMRSTTEEKICSSRFLCPEARKDEIRRRWEYHTGNCSYLSWHRKKWRRQHDDRKWDEECFVRKLGSGPFLILKRAQRIMGAGEIGIPVSPRDLGALCGYHGDLIG